MYLFGGEDGFTCESGERCPPYYNDVWRSRNGADWELVTAEAPWAPRPGHQVVKVWNKFVLFGGFGLSTDPTNPFAPANPMDTWISRDGAHWEQVDGAPWNAVTPGEVKYDFAAIVTRGGRWGLAAPDHDLRRRSRDLRLHGSVQLPERRQRRVDVRPAEPRVRVLTA